MVIDWFDFIYDCCQIKQVEVVIVDIVGVLLEIEVCIYMIDLCDFWDFQEVYGVLYDFVFDY